LERKESYLNQDRIKPMVVDCTLSFTRAVQQAGGEISDRILDMSVREFISNVASQNGIRFIYDPDKM
jgi:hypothetical protein